MFYTFNVCICLACLFLPPWTEPTKFVIDIFISNFPIYALLLLTAQKPYPQSMASSFVTCGVMCSDLILQWVINSAFEDKSTQLVTREVFQSVRWILFSIGWFWSVVVVDNSRQISRTFAITLPLFLTVSIVVLMQGAIIANQNLQVLRSVLKHARLAQLPANTSLLFFESKSKLNHTIEFVAPKKEITSWVNRSAGTITVAPLKQKNGALEFNLSPNPGLSQGKVLVIEKSDRVKVIATLMKKIK